MKQSNVFLSIKGTHTTEFDTGTLEFTTSGILTADGENYSVHYQEMGEQGENDSAPALFISENGKVIIRRPGGYGSYLVLEKGQRNLSHYDTESGPMLMSISAREIVSGLKDGLGELFIDYTLEMNYQMVSENQLHITIRKAGENNVKPHPAS